eukprot:1485086-Alexandrium_andersonii.AAC.1
MRLANSRRRLTCPAWWARVSATLAARPAARPAARGSAREARFRKEVFARPATRRRCGVAAR